MARPVDPNERLFATIQASDGTMPINERVQTDLPALSRAGDGAARRRASTLRPFRDGTPYQGEEMVYEQAAPEHFLARCSPQGRRQHRHLPVGASRRQCRHHVALSARVAERLENVAAGIDKLMARWRPAI